MLFNQLHLLPTQETQEYLQSVMSTCPFDYDLSKLSLVIITTQDEMPAIPQGPYKCMPTKAEMVYNSEIESSSLVVSFDSPQLLGLYAGLNKLGIEDAFYKKLYPHMTLVQYVPALSSPTKRFVLGMSNIFGDSKTPLYFSNPISMAVDLSYPPDSDYQNKSDQESMYGVSPYMGIDV